jgi:hypothetical protein
MEKTEKINVLEQKIIIANAKITNNLKDISLNSLKTIRHNISQRKLKELSGMFELVDDCVKHLAGIAQEECKKRFQQ